MPAGGGEGTPPPRCSGSLAADRRGFGLVMDRSSPLDGVAAGATRTAENGFGNDTKEPCRVKSETPVRPDPGRRQPVPGWLRGPIRASGNKGEQGLDPGRGGGLPLSPKCLSWPPAPNSGVLVLPRTIAPPARPHRGDDPLVVLGHVVPVDQRPIGGAHPGGVVQILDADGQGVRGPSASPRITAHHRASPPQVRTVITDDRACRRRARTSARGVSGGKPPPSGPYGTPKILDFQVALFPWARAHLFVCKSVDRAEFEGTIERRTSRDQMSSYDARYMRCFKLRDTCSLRLEGSEG